MYFHGGAEKSESSTRVDSTKKLHLTNKRDFNLSGGLMSMEISTLLNKNNTKLFVVVGKSTVC